MGLTNSKQNSETINWNNLKTENMSSSMPNFNGLSNEAKQLIASLNIPEITETESSEFTVSRILNTINTGLNKNDQNRFHQILEQVSSQSEDLSNTSPFISSEMYEYLVNSKSSENGQTGGAKKANKKSKKYKSKKGGSLDNDSSTSSTSSDSSMEDILDSTEEEIIKEKNKKNKKSKDSSDSELSGGELSYLSSSAHTGGEFSDSEDSEADSEKSSEKSSVESSSQTETTEEKLTRDEETVTDENKDMMSTSISVNTEDINMISDY